MSQGNFLSPLGFQFKLSKIPNTTFNIQQVSLPGINLGVTSISTPFTKVSKPGNIVYSELNLTFLADENLSNYLELWNWMVELGFPENFDQYRQTDFDASLVVLNSSKRPVLDITMHSIFPTSISPLDFDTTITDVQYITINASFSFDTLRFNEI